MHFRAGLKIPVTAKSSSFSSSSSSSKTVKSRGREREQDDKEEDGQNFIFRQAFVAGGAGPGRGRFHAPPMPPATVPVQQILPLVEQKIAIDHNKNCNFFIDRICRF
jgi:hypothetical protein